MMYTPQNKLNDALEMLGSLAGASGMTFLQKLNCESSTACSPGHCYTPYRSPLVLN